jgi:hypothetical protein
LDGTDRRHTASRETLFQRLLRGGLTVHERHPAKAAGPSRVRRKRD